MTGYCFSMMRNGVRCNVDLAEMAPQEIRELLERKDKQWVIELVVGLVQTSNNRWPPQSSESLDRAIEQVVPETHDTVLLKATFEMLSKDGVSARVYVDEEDRNRQLLYVPRKSIHSVLEKFKKE